MHKMTSQQVREASRRLLAEERAATTAPSETTPSEITSAVVAFAKDQLGGEPLFVPVISDPNGLYGWCSDGVLQKVSVDGGSIVFGWTIWEWPQIMLTAEFHAAWRDPDGKLVDVTPKPHREERILFVPDFSYREDFDFDERPRNRRVRTRSDGDPGATVARLRSKLSPAQTAYEEKRAAKAGTPLDQWLLRKLPVDPLNTAIDKVISSCDAFEAYHDTFGGSGVFEADERFRQLAERRHAAVEQLKRLTKSLGVTR